MAIGDSTVEGVGASDALHTYASLVHAGIALRHKKTIYFNFGKSGAHVHDVTTGQLHDTIKSAPGLITVSVGANDIVRNTRIAAFRQDFDRLIYRLRKETNSIIVITDVPNFSVTPAVPRRLKLIAERRIRRINTIIHDVANNYNAILIEAFEHGSVFMRQFPDEVLFEDGFHPSNLGYALWANTILTVLEGKLL